MRHVIVGGVAGGATAAARIRRMDETAEIVLIEKGEYISYANCGLPYYIGGVIAERDKLFLQTPRQFAARFRIDVRTANEALSVHPENRTLLVRDREGKEYRLSYDRLLLSPGAVPVRPPLPGIGSAGIFTLRNVDDTDRIKAFITSRPVSRAVVIGAGFIGLEMAENLVHAGIRVSVVERDTQVMAPIDYSMASLVHEHLFDKGIDLYLEQSVTAFEPDADALQVCLADGSRLAADLVILSIGVRPETTLARAAGLRIGESGGIWVDGFLQTSAPGIYAVGDAIEYPHPLTGRPWLNYLAGPANRQARIVADNMVLGNRVEYEGSVGTSVAKVFDLTVAATGLPAKRLAQWNMPYLSSVTHSTSHAGYYPGARPLTLKLVFDPVTGRLFGAQCIGYGGVDKRIDQLALLIKRGGCVQELMELEQAYAPPFSSAKDPIAIGGYVADHLLGGRSPVVTWRDVAHRRPAELTLVDVRTPDEFALGSLPGALNIPLDEVRSRLSEIPARTPVWLFCAVGLRGYLAQRILLQHGFDAKNLSGGYKLYRAAVAPPSGWLHASVEPAPAETGETPPEGRIKIDACGLQCPGPILKMKNSMDAVATGQQIEMMATDAGFVRDAQSWCRMTGNKLVAQSSQSGRYSVVIEKSGPPAVAAPLPAAGKGKTLILFSDDLDRALATFILANGAAATGEKVTLFFTFWGLNVIKKSKKPPVNKDFFGRMFSFMLPSDSRRLKLSKMNMGGAGSRMMRLLMKKRGVDSLESLREQALANGVEFIACQMSMEVMGMSREELLDEVTVGGVATYLERADSSNINLFI